MRAIRSLFTSDDDWRKSNDLYYGKFRMGPVDDEFRPLLLRSDTEFTCIKVKCVSDLKISEIRENSRLGGQPGARD